MNAKDPAYLYTFKVTVTVSEFTDVYRLKFGIRSLKWSNKEILINEKPFYCKFVVFENGLEINLSCISC